MDWDAILTVDIAGYRYGRKIRQFLLEADKWYARYYVLYYLSRLCGISELEIYLLYLVKRMRRFEQDEAMLVIVDDLISYIEWTSDYHFSDYITRMLDTRDCIDVTELTEKVYVYMQQIAPKIPWKKLTFQKFTFLGVMYILNDRDFMYEITGYEGTYEICEEFRAAIHTKLSEVGWEVVERILAPDMVAILSILGMDVLSERNLSLFRDMCRVFRHREPDTIFTEKVIDFLEIHRKVSDIVFVEHFLELTHRAGISILLRFYDSQLTDKVLRLAEMADKGEIYRIWEEYKRDILEYYPEIWRYRGYIQKL